MKFILSRKGFDAENGKIPSPILPDGRLISFPIPSNIDSINFSELKFDNESNYLDRIISLHGPNSPKYEKCHLDPDIYPAILKKRPKNWLPLFGQIGAAQTHLKGNQIKINDVFLFFGWFRHTKFEDRVLVFDKNKRFDLHVIFGYFQINKIIETKNYIIPSWMQYHPHADSSRQANKTNCIYVAKKKLSWNKELPGSSPFYFVEPELVLTKKSGKNGYLSRSKWYFDEKTFGKEVEITYHNELCWKNDYFQSAKRGQEFIMEECQEVEDWGKNLIANNINDFY